MQAFHLCEASSLGTLKAKESLKTHGSLAQPQVETPAGEMYIMPLLAVFYLSINARTTSIAMGNRVL